MVCCIGAFFDPDSKCHENLKMWLFTDRFLDYNTLPVAITDSNVPKPNIWPGIVCYLGLIAWQLIKEQD